jgi:hypothetical protein
MVLKMIQSDLFRGREPLTEEDFTRLTLGGYSGAFRENIRDHQLDPEGAVFFGVQVLTTAGGGIIGCQPVKCGSIGGVTLNIKDVWENSVYEGKVIIEPHDASVYVPINGQMTSRWTEEVPWRAKVNIEGKWKGVKKGNLKDSGLTDLCFRMSSQPVTVEGTKCLICVVPCCMTDLTARGDAGGRFFPIVRVTEVRAKMFPMEESHHKFGVGVQPLLWVEDAPLDEQGEIDFSKVVWPSSQEVKDAGAKLLQSATMPNVHLNSLKWRETLEKHSGTGTFPRRPSTFSWPTPRREDVDTEPEDNFEDVSGEKSYCNI